MKECLKLLKRLDFDLVALQEWRRLDPKDKRVIWQDHDPNQGVAVVSTQASRQMGPDGESRSVIWRGTNPDLGVAVISKEGAPQIKFVKISFLHPTIVPVIVDAPEPFVFVGVWTHPEPSYAKVAWEAMSACARAADKLQLPMVAAGDFNIWPGLKKKADKNASLEFLKCVESKLGLLSAYHHHYNRKAGEERHATHYFQFKKARVFHLDYCFVPKDWRKKLITWEVGPFMKWCKPKHSDHCPMTVEIRGSTNREIEARWI
ncbi:MAG: hypothetical protein OXN89_18645 [Bryobacterales bacterium]|nr:hypothetical protein [Bryobacterales bacterium]